MRKIIFAVILVVAMSTISIAEDLSSLNGQPIPSNAKVTIGVTDDANKNPMVFRTDTNGYLKVSFATALNSSNDSTALDFVSTAVSNISTATTTASLGTNGALNSMIVNTGVSGTAAFYNIASAGCTGTPVSGYAFTLSTTTAAIFDLHHNFTLGICVVTSTTANISILYKDLP